MAVKQKSQKQQKQQEAEQPLILRAHRLMEAFAKSDDERDFYIDRMEGFLFYVDLDKSEDDIDALEKELTKNPTRYCMIPKLTFYEAKKIMEGFVNEKVYDVDTKEKLLDIIQAKEARANFLEFIYDHHSELEKWQQYYQERSRVRIIEWLRQHHFHFVFEEDLELSRNLLEKLKQGLFDSKPSKEVLAARKILITKAKGYYSNEALNPRPKRGRPPKQITKQEIEPQVTSDLYLTVPSAIRPFLFTPDISSASAVTFSADFETQAPLTTRRHQVSEADTTLASLQQKLATLRKIAERWVDKSEKPDTDLDDFDEDDDDDDEAEVPFEAANLGKNNKQKAVTRSPLKKMIPKKVLKTKAPSKPKAVSGKLKPVLKSATKGVPGRKQKHKRIIPVNKSAVKIKTKPLIKAAMKSPARQPSPVKKKPPSKISIGQKKQKPQPKGKRPAAPKNAKVKAGKGTKRNR